MHRHNSILRCAAMLLALAFSGHAMAAQYTEVVTFFTDLSDPFNNLEVQGTVNTLAQGLNVVPFDDNDQMAVGGTLTASLTFETFSQSPPQLVGVEFLENSFSPSNLNLSYRVLGTNRLVGFTTNNVSFSMDLPDIHNPAQAALQAAASSQMSQIVHSSGMAEVSITNRPSRSQDLSDQPVIGTNLGSPTLDNFDLIRAISGIDYLVYFTLPMQYQQVQFNEVGLPVSLNYSGTLLLTGYASIPNVPEPSTLGLVLCGAMLLSRRGGRHLTSLR